MESSPQSTDPQLSIEERRLHLEEKRLLLDESFARKWLPTFATAMVGLIAGLFSYVQQYNASQMTKRAQIVSEVQAEREWGFKIVEMYLNRREIFDLTKNPEQAALNLRVLAAVAPTMVQSVLNAEQSRLPPPSGTDDSNRLESLAAVAGVQDALANARPAQQVAASSPKPSDFTVYVQYPESHHDTALKSQILLVNLGYRVPGIEQVAKPPSRLQVRYYRQDQRDYAGKLATELGVALALPTSADNAILVRSSKKLPDGILEVWLPS